VEEIAKLERWWRRGTLLNDATNSKIDGVQVSVSDWQWSITKTQFFLLWDPTACPPLGLSSSWGKMLGNIVVGDIDDIGQPQCYICIKKQKILWKRKKKDICDIVIDQCHNVTQILYVVEDATWHI